MKRTSSPGLTAIRPIYQKPKIIARLVASSSKFMTFIGFAWAMAHSFIIAANMARFVGGVGKKCDVMKRKGQWKHQMVVKADDE